MPEQHTPTIGMGITFTDESALQPADIATLKADAATGVDTMSAFDGPYNPETGTGPSTPPRKPGRRSSHGSKTGSPVPRAPTQSPRLPTHTHVRHASGSSFHRESPGTEHRQRFQSPKNYSSETVGGNDILPLLHTQTLGANLADQQSPIWSPAMDGKKEPSIKPATFGYDSHDATMLAQANAKNRARSSYISTNKPLTGALDSTAIAGGPAASEGGFYDSTAYWLGMYFFFNLGLTLFNKLVLVSFPFPYVGQHGDRGKKELMV